MNKYLYNNFLEDKTVYKENVAFWDKIAKNLLQIGNYTFEEYIATDDGYGNVFYDGNPIYSFMIDSLNKAVKIVQEEPEESGNRFAAFINATELPSGKKLDELVINIQLTRETALLAINIMQAWTLSNLTKQQMKQYIQDFAKLEI